MNIRRWIITIAACVTVFVLLAAYKVFEIKAAIAFGESFPEPSATVEVVTIDTVEAPLLIEAIGEIIAPRMVVLRNELAGRITAVNFSSGESVKKQSLLVQLDISEEQARLDGAVARASLAELNLNRVQQLLAKKSANQGQLDQADAEFRMAQAEVAAMEAIIDKKTIVAPFAGKTGLHLFEVGQFLDRNTVITTLVATSDYYWVDFNLPVTQAAALTGNRIDVFIPEVTSDVLTATIVAQDSAASASSRHVKYRAKLETSLTIPVNTMVKLAIFQGTQATIQIPLAALRKDTAGDYVYKLLPDEKTGAYRGRRQQVSVGQERGEFVSITEGLEPGQLIATHGAFKVRDGLLVYVAEASSHSESVATTPAQPATLISTQDEAATQDEARAQDEAAAESPQQPSNNQKTAE